MSAQAPAASAQATPTLSRHLLEAGSADAGREPELARLLVELAYAAKVLDRDVGRAALAGLLGLQGGANVTGDAQKKLDVFANEATLTALEESGVVAAVVSEEVEDVHRFRGREDAPFVVAIDPLDGSSNTDVNGSLGTIFGVHRRRGDDVVEDLLRPAAELVCAGYVMYGTSTLLVYSAGGALPSGFTLDRGVGEFLLSHRELRCPTAGAYYSANLARLPEWSPGVQAYVAHATECDAPTGRPYSLRYSGALVADVHRCLIDGGIYFYPADDAHPDGKLRLVYECAPLAYVVDAAGGLASTGRERVLDRRAAAPHERIAFAIGSAVEVERYERLSRTMATDE